MPGVVDSHVHLLPPGLGRAIRAFFDADHYDTATFTYPLDHDETCRRLASEGIGTVWSLPYARRAGTADGLNEAMAATVVDQTGGPVEVIGGATVHPGDDDPAGVVRTAVEDLGLRVLKLHCSVGDFTADDPRLDPVWAYVSDIALPVVIHAGHPSTGHTLGADVTPLGTVAGRWPEVRLIVAHCGHPAGAAVLDLLAAHPQLHADLTPVVHELVDVDRSAWASSRPGCCSAPTPPTPASPPLPHWPTSGVSDSMTRPWSGSPEGRPVACSRRSGSDRRPATGDLSPGTRVRPLDGTAQWASGPPAALSTTPSDRPAPWAAQEPSRPGCCVAPGTSPRRWSRPGPPRRC
jgi:hypothetical protein